MVDVGGWSSCGPSWTCVDISSVQRGTPCHRSAHVMCFRSPGSVASPRAVIVHAGETDGGQRLSCTWSLDLDDLAAGRPPWTQLRTKGDALARSNHAAVVHENELFVFGGVVGRNPGRDVADLEILNLDTLCWAKHNDFGEGPSPRQNPTLVLYEGSSFACLVSFGGYDRSKKFNDVFCFDLTTYTWRHMALAETDATSPPPITDHCAAMVDGSMVVFGGIYRQLPDEQGIPLVWRLNLDYLSDIAVWERVECAGEAPLNCTAHAATSIGHVLLVAGGQRNWAMVPLQLHVLDLRSCHWSNFGQPCPAFRVCRHAAVLADGFFMIFGGHNGERHLNGVLRISLAELMTSLSGNYTADRNTEAKALETSSHPLTATDMFNVERTPLTLADLPPEVVHGKSSRQLIRILHSAAVARHLDMYIDPESGYPAFTKIFLERRECCGNGCRHCPWGHVNVPKKTTPEQRLAILNNTGLDW